MNPPSVPGLRYVSDELPGIRRVRRGRAFAYVDPSGRPLRDERALARIAALAIPPAYEDVWIAPIENAHIQATGRDARGRKQYRYHARWREVRDETKFARMLEFAKALPRIRRRVDRDLRRKGMVRERVLATVVRLLETTAIRIGNDEYARDNNSYGLTTMRNAHAQVRGDRITFRFRGKRGIAHAIGLNDRRIARVVLACQDLPGQQLFEYVDDSGAVVAIDSSDVNEYIRTISGGDFTAKDFRTWVGTVLCASLLAAADPPESAADGKRRVVEAIAQVARCLGNTPAICRKCYVHPQVIDRYLQGRSGSPATSTTAASRGLTSQERYALRLLKNRRPSRVR